METTKFADMIGKVRGLLAKADSTDNPHEASALRDKAEALMFKHKIDMATAPAEERKAGGYAKPEWRSIDLCAMGNQWYRYYSGIALAIVRHIDARSVMLRDSSTGMYVLRVVGFAGDLDYLEMLLASATLAFGKRMEPKVDPTASEATNAFNLRMGGMERERIAVALWGPLSDEEAYAYGPSSNGRRYVRKPSNATKARGRKVTKLITEGAVAAEVDPKSILGQGNSIKTFRESYANGFYFTLVNRLRDLALNRGETDKGMVLASLEAQVEDMFYGEYPDLRPANTGRAEYIPPNEKCDKCKGTKSGYCRDHQFLKPSKAKAKPGSYNYEAANMGSAAARTVDLGPGGTAKAPAAPTRTELG
jgi:hypothetical protein